MLTLEQEAVLAIVNDENHSDIRELSSRLSGLPLLEAQQVLQQVLNSRTLNGLGDNDNLLVRALRKEITAEDVERYQRLLHQYENEEVRLLTPWSAEYPARLSRAPAPPLMLYVRGRIFPPVRPYAVVGTRQVTPRGVQLCREFVSALISRGHTIVSGLAWGTDTAAHKQALASGGATIAILAGHIDHIHPPWNLPLAREIVVRGSLVSEITRYGVIHKGRFIERNRITSGISEAVLIVESPKYGGTIHQAKFALGQGRPTYVIDQGTFDTREAEEGFRHLVSLGVQPVRKPEELPDPSNARPTRQQTL